MNDEITSASELAAALRQARRERHLTQASAAASSGISRQHLSNIESAKGGNVELQTLLRLLSSYGLSMRIEPESLRPTLNQILRERKREQVK
jgi:transcriptional regulator with XRE-family HTH domain